MAASPSALSKLPPGAASDTQTDEPPAFDGDDLEMWLEFQRERGKAVSKDTWSLFIDFLRTIDKEYKEYDEEGEFRCYGGRTDSHSCLAVDNRRLCRVCPREEGEGLDGRQPVPRRTNVRYPFPHCMYHIAIHSDAVPLKEILTRTHCRTDIQHMKQQGRQQKPN